MTIYDQLTQFTLFQGMSRSDLMEVVAHTRLGFMKGSAGKRIVKEGDDSSTLILMTHGELECETISDDHQCRVVERMVAPYMIQPERCFGMTQKYTSTFKALSECNFITIDKQEIMLLLETQLVFRLNMLNMLAADAQRMRHRAWQSAPKTLRERIVRFFFSRCIYPAGSKTFYILMKQLANELNDSRLDISNALNEMEEDGLLNLYRGRIEIPMLERLLM